MAFDDPIVWVLIIAVVVFLFGSAKIPQFAKALGQARREFETGWKGATTTSAVAAPAVVSAPYQSATSTVSPPASSPTVGINSDVDGNDPLVVAARNEGIDTRGKTRDQIASELALKLKGSQN
jgi:sec-independent protein translocase protein TatA